MSDCKEASLREYVKHYVTETDIRVIMLALLDEKEIETEKMEDKICHCHERIHKLEHTVAELAIKLTE